MIVFDKTYSMGTASGQAEFSSDFNTNENLTQFGYTAAAPSQSSVTLTKTDCPFGMTFAAASSIFFYSASAVGVAAVSVDTTTYLRVVVTDTGTLIAYYANTDPTTSATAVSTAMIITKDTEDNVHLVYVDNSDSNNVYVVPKNYIGSLAAIPVLAPLTTLTGFPQCCIYNVPSTVAVGAKLDDVCCCATLADNIVCGDVEVAGTTYVCLSRHTGTKKAYMLYKIA